MPGPHGPGIATSSGKATPMTSAMDIMHAYLRERNRAEAGISSIDPCARLRVIGARGGPLDVPVETFTYVHRDATKKRAEHSYVKPAEQCKWCGAEDVSVHTDCYQDANVGLRGKGTPTYRKRIPTERVYIGMGTALGASKQVIRFDPDLELAPIHFEDLQLDPQPDLERMRPAKAFLTPAQKAERMQEARAAARAKMAARKES